VGKRRASRGKKLRLKRMIFHSFSIAKRGQKIKKIYGILEGFLGKNKFKIKDLIFLMKLFFLSK